jgi:hypothetical protein
MPNFSPFLQLMPRLSASPCLCQTFRLSSPYALPINFPPIMPNFSPFAPLPLNLSTFPNLCPPFAPLLPTYQLFPPFPKLLAFSPLHAKFIPFSPITPLLPLSLPPYAKPIQLFPFMSIFYVFLKLLSILSPTSQTYSIPPPQNIFPYARPLRPSSLMPDSPFFARLFPFSSPSPKLPAFSSPPPQFSHISSPTPKLIRLCQTFSLLPRFCPSFSNFPPIYAKRPYRFSYSFSSFSNFSQTFRPFLLLMPHLSPFPILSNFVLYLNTTFFKF